MQKKLLFSIYLLFINALIAGASMNDTSGNLTGKVVDSSGEGIPSAAVALVKEENRQTLALAICDEQGIFILKNVPQGKYQLQISVPGYLPDRFNVTAEANGADLGTFVLKENAIELDSLEIKATRQVKAEVDRLIYSLENDPDAAKKTIMELLDKIPFIETDKITNEIKVMGSARNFSITVDGKKSILLSNANQYVSKMLKGGNLKQIELITSPDGKYMDQTAVINIVTKSTPADGLAGYVSANGNVENQLRTGTGINLTSKMGGLIYNISNYYEHSDEYGNRTWENRTNYKSAAFMYGDIYTRNAPGAANIYLPVLRASYEIGKLDLISMSFSPILTNRRRDIFSHNLFFNSNHTLSREYEGRSHLIADNRQYEGSVDYQRSYVDNPEKLLTATYTFDINRNYSENRLEQIESIAGFDNSDASHGNRLKSYNHTAAVDFYNSLKNRNSYYVTAQYINRLYGSDAWTTDHLSSAPPHTNRRAGLLSAGSLPERKLFDAHGQVHDHGQCLLRLYMERH